MSSVVITMMGRGGRTFPVGIPAGELATSFGIEKSHDLLGFRVGKVLFDLQSPITSGGSASPIYFSDDSPDARYFYRHSLSHILAQAVKRLHPEAKLGIGLATEDGFYYDFEIDEPLSQDDLSVIEDEMKQIVQANFAFERLDLTLKEGRLLLQKGGEILKLEILRDFSPDSKSISFYRDEEFIDLCNGPHVPSTKAVSYFKLLDVVGTTYWHGGEKRRMLQRIYATAFLRKDDLSAHLVSIEEAKKRDHRKLGRELDLFSMSDEVGPGLILWHPRGGLIRQIIEEHYVKRHREAGYDFVNTPHIGKKELWETSGHLDFYHEAIFPAMDIEGQTYYLKPMNCPFHVQIYNSRLRSYRELPVRFAEWGTVYRFEQKATLHGAANVRGFTQDDAHLFCSQDQTPEEIDKVLEFSINMLADFGLNEFNIYLSTRPEKRVGADEEWDIAEKVLKEALDRSGRLFAIKEGEGAFFASHHHANK